MIIPERYRGRHHGGFNRFHTTGVKKVMGSWMKLPAIDKNGGEKNVEIALAEEKDEDGSQHIIALMK